MQPPRPTPLEADPRFDAALDGAIRHLAGQVIAEGGGPPCPREARQHVWGLLEIQTGLRPANPNNAAHVRALCMAGFDLLGEWSPESLDLFFPLPE